jgi:hypothetical protein
MGGRGSGMPGRSGNSAAWGGPNEWTTIGDAINEYKKGGIKKGEYLRWDERDFKSGELVPVSRRWVDNKLTTERLSGTSTISPRSRLSSSDKNALYKGYVYVVKGIRYRKGYDVGEVILKKAIVVKKL